MMSPARRMPERVAVLLDTDRVRVLSTRTPGAVLADVEWNPDAPQHAITLLSAKVPPSTSAVLVVGIGLLEVAQPELPPLDAKTRRLLLLRDADRYFPLSGDVAVSWADGFAFAVRSDALSAWIREFGAHVAIRGVTTVVECLTRANANGTWMLATSPRESGYAEVRDGRITDVRRQPIPAATAAHAAHGQDASGENAVRTRGASAQARSLDLSAVARGAAALSDGPLDAMLLDESAHRRFRGARRAQWLASSVALVAAIAAVAWAADFRRGRQLDAMAAQTASLAVAAAPAMRAAERLHRARAELDAVSTVRVEPGAVLSRLGALLPRDAFVQRLEWDGTVWRIDGSALDAPRIVPLLDASAAFDDVRIVAASTRFLDAGRQRESFSISFRPRSEPAVAAGK